MLRDIKRVDYLCRLRKLVAEKQADEASMTREEFFNRIEEARKQLGRAFCNVNELDRYIQRI